MKYSNEMMFVRSVLLAGIVIAGASNSQAGDGQYLDRMDKVTHGAGNAVAHNMAVQTIDPWPRYVGNDRIHIDGNRIALAHKRYQANKSIVPRGLSTSGVLSAASPNGADTGGAPSEAK